MSTPQLTGDSIVGRTRSAGNGVPFRAVNPQSGEEIAPDFHSASVAELETACVLAQKAAPVMASLSGGDKGRFLRSVAGNIEQLGRELTERVTAETGLSAARVQSEAARTCFQLRLFAELVEEGSWVDARIDRSNPDRKPLPKPDMRSLLRPIGPVAVFGASNFPLAYSVAGGDSASAWAAGNPVIVKAHPAHPGTSEMVGKAILRSVGECGLPEGTFSLLFDAGFEIAAALVKHRAIKAVGFTGSRRGGCALMQASAARAVPIPFYAEMGSLNPVFLLPSVFAGDWKSRADALFASVTQGSGQFCTKPGLVFMEASAAADAFANRLREKMQSGPRGYTMLAPGIQRVFDEGVAERGKQNGIVTMRDSGAASGRSTGRAVQVEAALFRTDAKTYLATANLEQEIFGPSTVLITYANRDEMLEIAHHLEGQLTATVHGTGGDPETAELVAILETKAGRLIFNGLPTGLEVGPATVHGGPWPATSDSHSSSVGTRAITRFARPVCYQNFPHANLPDELKDPNPLGILRMIDGQLTRDALSRPTPATP